MPTVIFKATEACNCRCAYCDVVSRRKPLTINNELMDKAFMRFEEYLEAHPDERLDIIWHGGEPLMAPVALYRRALSRQRKMHPEVAGRISYMMQSNLTAVTPETVNLLTEMGITRVGTSYDPAPGVRGLGSQRDTAEYNRRFFHGINLLEDAGISFAFIYVVTAVSLDRPLDIFNHLQNLSPRGNFSFNPVLVYRDATPDARATAITGEQYADFLGAILPSWLERREALAEVEPLASVYRYYTTGIMPQGCNEAPSCGSMVYIGPDGSTSLCGRAADYGLLPSGNIAETSLDAILDTPARRELDTRSARLSDGECRDCQYFPLCHGGCPLDAWDNTEGHTFMARTSQCDFRRRFLSKYFEPLTGLTVPQPSTCPRHD